MDPDVTPPDAPTEDHDRLGMAIAILLAVVAVVAAFAAWRTSVVGSAVGDMNRTGLIDVSKQQVMRQIDVNAAYTEAAYGADATMKKAYAESLSASGLPALETLGATIADNSVAAMEPVAGPFMAGTHLTSAGTFDVDRRIDELNNANADYVALDPQSDFVEADRLAGEKTWLTIVSVLFAIALFWLGMAEITAGRWRWVNLAVGVVIFVLTLGMFGAVELFFMSGGGAA